MRTATREDLPAIVALLTDGEGEADARYAHAFDLVDGDPRNEMLVLDDAGAVVGYLQATYIPGLGGHGRERALLEGVRVRSDRRGAGLGRALVEAAIERAAARGCTLVSLASNKRRADAHRFYESLGFVRSHEGFRLYLER